MDKNRFDQEDYFFTRTESILIECFSKVFSQDNPDVSIGNVLEYLGQTFHSDRAYIFELYDNGRMSNTYEWCQGHVVSQKEALQEDVSNEVIGWWLEKFYRSELVIIENLEDIRDTYPITYAGLKPQDIQTLMVGPIEKDGKLIGFFGLDNPDKQLFPLLKSVLKVSGYFIGSILKQRDSKHHLENLSFHDALTGVFNRNALFEQFKSESSSWHSIGVIYCDVTGLKQVNDSLGHSEGDILLVNCCRLLQEQLDSSQIYRIGGDEFVMLLPNLTESDFYAQTNLLRNKIRSSSFHMALGCVWTDQPDYSFDELLSKADAIMYEDKREYYSRLYIEKGIDRRHLSEQLNYKFSNKESDFNRFLSSTYCDFEALCQSMTQSNSSFFLYFGDMQKDIFYVSDNMRDTFGLKGNIVPGLLKIWEERIAHPEHLELYRQDVADMLENKRTIHDLRYQVRDINGNDIWIRCYGILKWNEDKTVPLFFSGRVSCQDSDFVVDPLTNFLRDDAAAKRIQQLRDANDYRVMIGFSLNSFTEINNTKGRAYGNRLIQLVSNHLLHELTPLMSFYRLDGLDFLAILNPETEHEVRKQIQQIRSIVEKCYLEMKLSLKNSSSFCIIGRDGKDLEPEELLAIVRILIKAAKNEPEKEYVEYSPLTLQDARHRSDMALLLSENVLNNMENFRIVVQPVVSAKTRHIIGGEALLRWSLRDAPVSPAVFVPILEKENMIQAVGRWVFKESVRACRKALSYIPDFYISFNVSFQQLSDKGFLDFMKKTLENYHVDGSHLVAELTETHFDEQPDELMHFVDGCRNLSIRVALDDFGNGYSSLRMLLQYPSNIVKLDRSLLSGLTESKEKLKFIRSIVFACHQFDKTVCVEGVETSLERDLVTEAECDSIQGFYYYKPMEIVPFYQLLSKDSQEQAKEN